MTSENTKIFCISCFPNFDFREFQLRLTSTLSNKYKYLRLPGSGEKHVGERTQTPQVSLIHSLRLLTKNSEKIVQINFYYQYQNRDFKKEEEERNLQWVSHLSVNNSTGWPGPAAHDKN